MTALRIAGTDGEALSYVDGLLVAASSKAFAPGQPAEVVLGDASPARLVLACKSLGSRKRDDGRFEVRFKVLNLSRDLRAKLERALGAGPAIEPLFPDLRSFGDKFAVHLAGRRDVRWPELAGRVSAYVQSLESLPPGARIGVWTHGTLETIVALVGNALARCVSVPLNPHIGSSELAHVLADARPARIVVSPGEPVPTLDARVIADAQSDVALPVRPVDDAPLLVLYTSGTTGPPKGAVLTARNVAFDLDALARAWQLDRSAVVVHALPLFHVHGLCLALFGSLRRGARHAWLPKFDPTGLSALLGAAGARGVLYAVPTMIHRLGEAAEHDAAVRDALAGAGMLVSGSAGLPVREHARIERLTGQRIVERYGLTETLINHAIRRDGDRRAGTVGPPLEGVEQRLVDDARAPIEARDDVTLGELAVRGPNVFAGYLDRDDATRAVRDEDGWFYTGDLATISADGFARIVGRRATDLIKTGGFKVGAGEVEAALLEHPAVRECAVIGAPDDDLGERIVAYVVPREGPAPEPAELVAHVTERLSAHKRPRDVRFLAELPRNAMGKVLKTQLRGGG